MLAEDVEDGGGEIRVFAVFDELAQDAEAMVFALGQLRLRGGEEQSGEKRTTKSIHTICSHTKTEGRREA